MGTMPFKDSRLTPPSPRLWTDRCVHQLADQHSRGDDSGDNLPQVRATPTESRTETVMDAYRAFAWLYRTHHKTG